MKIGDFNTEDKVLIIAEIGNNHEGDFKIACEMIEAAADAGADAVKFQTITPSRLVSAIDHSRVVQLTNFSFSPEQFKELKNLSDRKNLIFLSTPFDLQAIEWLNHLVPAYKIASGDNDFWPLLEKVAQTGKPVLISLGLGKINEAQKLQSFITEIWVKRKLSYPGLGFLHCVVSYPTPDEEAFLCNIHSIKIEGITPGYSDHTLGTKAAELAVACGARIIEKHFTLDKSHSEFRDHKLSADPDEMRGLVNAISKVEQLLGRNQPTLQKCEAENETKVRRSISACRNIAVGEIISLEDICWVRPRHGLEPGREHLLLGKKLTTPIQEGESFTLNHFS